MLLPSVSSTVLGVVVLVALVDTTRLLTSRGEGASFTVLVDGVSNPVDLRIVADSVVGGVDKDDLKVLVGRVLVNPVGVEDTEVTSTTTNTLFGSSTEGSLVLELVDTHVGGLTVGSTLVGRALAATSADTDTVNNETLLGLVTETVSLVRARRTSGTVDGLQLTVLPASNSEEESQNIRLLLLVKLFKILVGTH